MRSEVAKLRQQQDVRPVVVEANHIPVERQELESWMNHRAGDLRAAIEENNADHVVGRRATATSFVGGRRCCFGGRFLCDGTWRGTVRTLLSEGHTQVHRKIWTPRHTCWGSRTSRPNPPINGCNTHDRSIQSRVGPQRVIGLPPGRFVVARFQEESPEEDQRQRQ